MTHRQAIVAFGGVMLGMLLAALDQMIVATALPRIASQLHSFDHLSWVVTAYLITSTVTVPLYGKLSDIYGRRRLFFVSISIFLLGSILCGASQTMTQLILSRGLQGLGAGGLIPLANAAIGDLFSPRERARWQGLTAVVWAVASVAGPLLGGFFTDSLTWRWIFWINLPLGVLALGVVAVAMRVPFRRRDHPIDFLGALTLSCALVSLLLVAVWGGQTYAWGSLLIVVLAITGVVLVVLFLAIETRAVEPLLPLTLFRNSIFVVSNIGALLVAAAMSAPVVFVPLFVQGVFGSSATSSGVVLIPLMVGWLVTSMISGHWIVRTGRYRVCPIAGTAIVLLGLWLLTRLGVDSSPFDVVVDVSVIGLGLGLTFQTYVLAVQNAVPPRDLGIATASVQFFRSIGAVFTIAVLGAILNTRLATELPRRLGDDAGQVDPQRLLQSSDAARNIAPALVDGVRQALSSSLHTVFLACLPVLALAFVASLFLREIPLRTTSGAAAAAEADRDPPAEATLGS